MFANQNGKEGTRSSAIYWRKNVPVLKSIDRMLNKMEETTMTSRKAISLLMGLLLVLFVSASALAADELYGTWRLVSFKQTVLDTGESRDIMGNSPQGFYNFGRDGRVLLLIISDKRPKVPDLAKLADKERAELFKTMIAYGGTYTFDGKTLKIRVDISYNENWTGTEQVRLVKFEGNKLVLSTVPAPATQDGKIVTAVITLERVK